MQWGLIVCAFQVKMCVNVHKAAQERWKNLLHGSNYRLFTLFFSVSTLKQTENRIIVSAKVWEQNNSLTTFMDETHFRNIALILQKAVMETQL